jgi:3-methylcrotonyl-CoA carboxylase alpha subunit
MPEVVRAAMGTAAVRAAKAIGYSGAGTIEFIVDGSGPLREDGFWFMEMNTRLQVEHPVTEAITGQDLVEWQLRVANGESLPKAQDELSMNGWAFEARIYAEDAGKGFLPSIGTLTHLQFPQNARSDTGVRAGDAITPHYDPMIAKLVVHGPTREVALGKLTTALAATQVAGCTTNIGFLSALSQHGGFAKGEVDTGLIARDQDALVAETAPSPEDWAMAAIALSGLDKPQPHQGFTLWSALKRTVHVACKDDQKIVALHCTSPNAITAECDGETIDITIAQDWTVNGRKPAAQVVSHAGGVSLFGSNTHHFTPVDLLDRAATVAGGAGTIIAPMPGAVKEVMVAEGDTVKQGDTLLILEAMKMEHRLTAPFDGTVSELNATASGQVADGTLLATVEEAEA